MTKFQTKSTNKLLTKFIIKSVISTVICVLCFTFLFSEIMFNLDIDIAKTNIFSLVMVGLSSLIIGYISVYSIKNSGIIMGILAQIPLCFYMIINVIFNDSNLAFFIIKLVIIVLCGALSGVVASEKSKKIKVKWWKNLTLKTLI